MASKTVRTHPEIIRREGLGAQQCTGCGTVYMDTEIPESCDSWECPTNRPSGSPTEYLSEGYRQGYEAALKDIIAGNAAAPKRYHLTEAQGQEVRDALKAYSAQLHKWVTRTEADRVWELAKLFE